MNTSATGFRHTIICGLVALGTATLLSGVSPKNTLAAKPDKEGSIEFEGAAPERSPYDVGQTESITLFESLLSETQSGSSSPHSVSPHALRYLAGTYLYCASKQGICPVILDGLLEADIANAQLTGKPSCPILEQFWELYTKWEFDKRENHLRGIGQVQRASQFAEEKLPRYQACTKSVAQALSEDKATRQAAAKKAFANAAFLLNQFKVKVPNVFTALGISGQ